MSSVTDQYFGASGAASREATDFSPCEWPAGFEAAGGEFKLNKGNSPKAESDADFEEGCDRLRLRLEGGCDDTSLT